MKKLLITLFIITSILGPLFPMNSAHATVTQSQVNIGYKKAYVPTNNVDAMNYNRFVEANATMWGATWNLPETKQELDDWVTKNPATAAQIAEANSKSNCGMTTPRACLEEFVYWVLRMIGNFILNVVSWILWVCGALFNLAIVTVVIHMKDLINNITVIFTTWKILRDFVNMFFIFILLAIAIQTILQTGNYKQMLTKVVLVALFINFSFFFTGVLIDASNTIALMFYKGFSNCTSTPQSGAVMTAVNSADGCMSYAIVNSLKLQTIYASHNSLATTSSSAVTAANDAAGAVAQNTYGAIATFLISVIAGSILMIIVAGVFLASAILILYRFVDLVMLLMLSPLAFAAIILPSTKKHWNTWWSKLSNQLIFAPAYFMFLWIVMSIITSKNDKGIGILAGALNVGNGSNFQSAFEGNMTQLFSLLCNYIIVISMLGYSLVLAKELGASGTEMATKVSKGFQGFVAKNTVGRASRATIGKASYAAANSRTMLNLTKSHPTLAGFVSKPLDKLGNQGFGLKDGYEKAMEKRKKAMVDTGKRVGETGLVEKERLFQRSGETNAAFKTRQVDNDKDYKQRVKDAGEEGKKRKAAYAEAIGGHDNSLGNRISNRLGISAALRSNKEAYAELSKQIGKDDDDKKAKDKRETDLDSAIRKMHELQSSKMGLTNHDLNHQHMGALPPVGTVVKTTETLASEAEIERVKDAEEEELTKLAVDIAALEANIAKGSAGRLTGAVATDKAALVDVMRKKKKLEKNRKDFDDLQNTITRLQDKIEQDNQTSKTVAAIAASGGGGKPAGGGAPTTPPAPKTGP